MNTRPGRASVIDSAVASQATPTSAAELLRIREARWLRVPVIARFVFIGFGALSLFGSGLSPSMMILICVALGIVIGVNLYFLHLLRKVRRLELVGIGGVMLDALNMIAGPVIWYQILAQGNLPVAELVKTPFILAQITLIVINSLALRPLYPLILTAVGILVEGGILVLARADPAVVWVEDPGLGLCRGCLQCWLVHRTCHLSRDCGRSACVHDARGETNVSGRGGARS